MNARSMRARGMIIHWVVSGDVMESTVVWSQCGRQGVLAGVHVGARCEQSRGCRGDGTRATDLLALRGSKSKHGTTLKGQRDWPRDGI